MRPRSAGNDLTEGNRTMITARRCGRDRRDHLARARRRRTRDTGHILHGDEVSVYGTTFARWPGRELRPEAPGI